MMKVGLVRLFLQTTLYRPSTLRSSWRTVQFGYFVTAGPEFKLNSSEYTRTARKPE